MTTTINASTSSGLVTTPDNSGAIALQANGTTALNISSGGVVTQPLKPAFFAYRSSSYGISAASPALISYDVTDINVGSCFSTSTYLFTAPVTGNYCITGAISFAGFSATQDAGGFIILKNGSTYCSGYSYYNPTSLANGYMLVTNSFLIPLTAGDTLGMRFSFSTGTATLNHDEKRTHFMGFLL